MNGSRFFAEARHCARLIVHTLTQRNLNAALTFYLTERNGLVWLAVVLNLNHMEGRLEGFISSETLHHLSTALHGKPVFLSNSTGLRYMILLNALPKLPEMIPYPSVFEKNSLPLGVGLSGPLTMLTLQNTLICGEPGSGKSNLLECLNFAATLHGWLRFYVDPDATTFNPDVINPKNACPVAQSAREFKALLGAIQAELARRRTLFQEAAQNGAMPTNLDEYNKIAKEPLPRMILFVDEANSYFDDKEILEQVTDLARRGRKWGLTIILAGHNWRAKDVPRGLSAMFPTRISFRVSDDTSAAVVLGSRHWGKQALGLRQPGRGILFMNGQYSIFQAYRLLAEQAVSAQPVEFNPLSDVERALVAYALEQLEGRFIVNRLAQAVAGQGISHHQVQKIAEQFERRSWLTKPQHATDARRITPELARLAGATHTGVQAVQAHTGAALPIQEPVQAGYA